MMIPRYIHQIFLSGRPPLRLAENVQSLKDRNPGWEHRLYSNDDAEYFISEHYDQRMLDTYRLINPRYGAARADLLRHLLIYKIGGVYLDIKSDLSKPLDEVLHPDDHYILVQWDNGPGKPHQGFGLHPELAHILGGEYQTYHIIAAPCHPFSKATIDRIVANIRGYKPWSGVGKMGVVRTTGPSAYTLAVHPLRNSSPHRAATEEELGASMSIAKYDHGAVFKKHYSILKSPVARLSIPARIVQIGLEGLRDLMRAFRG